MRNVGGAVDVFPIPMLKNTYINATSKALTIRLKGVRSKETPQTKAISGMIGATRPYQF